MMIKSAFVIILISISGLVLTNPVTYTSSNEKSENNISLDEAFHRAEKVLKDYSRLINSDTDHLVYGILHVLIKEPTSFTFIPRRAVDIVFKNLAEKLGYDDVETLSKPILLTLEQNYEAKDEEATKIELTDETKEKIEEVLDKFLDEENFNQNL